MEAASAQVVGTGTAVAANALPPTMTQPVGASTPVPSATQVSQPLTISSPVVTAGPHVVTSTPHVVTAGGHVLPHRAVTYPAGAQVHPPITPGGLAPVTFAASSVTGQHYTAPQAVDELDHLNNAIAAKDAEIAATRADWQACASAAAARLHNQEMAHAQQSSQKDSLIQSLTLELNETRRQLAHHGVHVHNLATAHASTVGEINRVGQVAAGVTYAHNQLAAQPIPVVHQPPVMHPAVTYSSGGAVTHTMM